MLRLKRLEQLLQLSGNGDKGKKDLLEKISEVNIIISQVTLAKQTGYLKKSLALKLGLQVGIYSDDNYNAFNIATNEANDIVMTIFCYRWMKRITAQETQLWQNQSRFHR